MTAELAYGGNVLDVVWFYIRAEGEVVRNTPKEDLGARK